MFASTLSDRPSLSSSLSVESGVPSASQSAAGGGVVPTVPGPSLIVEAFAGSTIGERDFGVFLLGDPEKTPSRKRVPTGAPLTTSSSLVMPGGTTTDMRRVLL